MPLFQRAIMETEFTLKGELNNVACFFFLNRGSMQSFDNRGMHETTMHNAILKSCGSYVQKFKANSGEKDCEAIAVFLYPALLKEIFKNDIPDLDGHALSHKPRKFIANRLIEQYMTNLSIYFDDPSAMDEELGTLKLKELIHILLKSENSITLRELLIDVFNPVKVAFKKAIENNLTSNLTIDQLAYICNMSLSSFKRRFKDIFDESPARYIKARRLEMARQKLIQTNDRIGDITYDLGFTDVTTFSAAFKSKYGTSPREFRKAHITK